MTVPNNAITRIALVYATEPTIEELDQFICLPSDANLKVVTSEHIAEVIAESSRFNQLDCIALPNHSDNLLFLPGLEQVLGNFDLVIIKGRVGIYAYQAVKAKRVHHFKLVVLEDSIYPFPHETIERVQTIRDEVTANADHFLVATKHSQTALELEGVSSELISRIQPWVADLEIDDNPKEKAQYLEKIGFKDGDFLIYYFGPLESEENLLELIHAISLLGKSEPSTLRQLRALIVGTGSQYGELKQRVSKLGLAQSIIFSLPNRDLHREALAASSAVFLSPICTALNRSMDPYRYLTAIVHRRPIISARNPISDVLLGKHRIDFCQGAVEALARTLSRVMSSPGISKDVVTKNAAKELVNFQRSQDDLQKFLNRVHSRDVAVPISRVDEIIAAAQTQIRQKKFVEAVDLISSVVEKSEVTDHQNSQLFQLVGECFLKLGDVIASQNSYFKSLSYDEHHAKSYVGLGTVSLTKRDYEVAATHFKKASQLDPKDDMAFLGLGLAFQGLDNLEEASSWIRQALLLNAENTAAIFTLVQISYELESYEETEKILQNYLELHPEDLNIQYSLAGIYFQQKKLGRAARILEELVAFNPLDEKAQFLLRKVRRAAVKEGNTNTPPGEAGLPYVR